MEDERFFRTTVNWIPRKGIEIVEEHNPDREIEAELGFISNLAQGFSSFGSKLGPDYFRQFVDAAKDLTGEGIEERIKDANV